MSAITLKKVGEQYLANINVQNCRNQIEKNWASKELARLYGLLCDVSNGPGGIIETVNALMEGHSGLSQEYCDAMNSAYEKAWDNIIKNHGRKFFGKKIQVVMSKTTAGDFDAFLE